MTALDQANSGNGDLTGCPGKKNLRRVADVAGLTLVGAFFVVLAVVTWRKWPDVLVDFGTQLYIPWRLNDGSVLYRDLFYFAGGPLSQYFNALLFKIFGVSFSTLIAANLLLAAALLGFIYRRFRAVSDALTATMICLGMGTVFIFANFTTIGNYIYIAPYSHVAVHGLLLSIYVLLVGIDHGDFGVGYFGSTPNDGADVMQWIRKNYQGVLVIGNEPLRDGRFGLEFLKRVAPPAGEAAVAPDR